MLNKIKTYSFLALIICVGFVSVFRLSNVNSKETSWDVLGYYLPLPATFIYDDPLMQNREWIEKINEEKQLTGTLYQISTNDQGEPIYFFLLGMAFLFLPFFLLGHGYALLFGYPPDGFSLPYQYFMVIGGVFYTIVGLIYFRKILLNYLPDKISAIVILIVVFGTNYTHHLTLKNLETINLLFLFMTLIIWNTIQWHKYFKIKNIIAIGLLITIASLVKPSEILLVLIPVFWNITSLKSLKSKFNLLLKYKNQLLIAFSFCIVLAIPQMMYWLTRTGHLFYDSYKNPGVGLDIASPHIFNTLFSYKKGWLVYTPVMILGLLGLYFMYKRNKKITVSLLIYSFVAFYIIASWSEWWYGAGFSIRPLIILYPIFGLAIGFLLVEINKNSFLLKSLATIFIVLCVFLNQFQWWQMRNGVLEPYRTTKEYYWATFLKTEATTEDRKHLSVFRSFKQDYPFKNQQDYELLSHNIIINEEIFQFNNEIEFSKVFEKPYKETTNKDHLWIRATVDVSQKKHQPGEAFLAISIDRKEGSYGYYTKKIDFSNDSNGWKKIVLEYMTPNIRDVNDRIKCLIWNKGKINFEIRNFKIEFFKKKET